MTRVKYLVTGGAGFIGSHIVARLVAEGEQVRVLDDLSSGALGNLGPLRDRIDLIEGDVRDVDTVARTVADVDIIFHEAAVPSVPRSVADPRTTIDVNVAGTLNLLLAARDAGCRRVVFASSSSVYGDTPVLPKVETMTPRPRSPYAISKLTGEQLCANFSDLYGLETVALRYFNVFGPRQDPASHYAAVIPKFLRSLLNGEQPTIFGDGEQSRDFTYVDNVVDANLRAARTGAAAGGVFNIASGRAISVYSMLHQIAGLLGVDDAAQHAPARPGDIRDSLADISAARAVLGFDPGVTFEEGLARTVVAAKDPVLA